MPHLNRQLSPPALAATLLALAALSSACQELIPVDNELAALSDVGPVTLQRDGRVHIPYTISDAEGDDQTLNMEICEGSATALLRCGFAFEGPGSDGVTFVPTNPRGLPQRQQFVWDAGCGRVTAEGVLPSELDTPYMARVSVRDAPEASNAMSAPFTLRELGLEQLPICER